MNSNRLMAGIIVIALIAAMIPLGAAMVGRFTPTHKIVEPVYCGACHPEQVIELNETTHLAHFASALNESAESEKQAISTGCMLCHNSWENRKWFGVTNLTVYQNEGELYGEVPYTVEFDDIISWDPRGFDVAYVASEGAYTNVTRWDLVWENISSRSPGPVSWTGCGGTNTVEKGLCHIAESAAALSLEGGKSEVNAQGGNGNAPFFAHEMAYTTTDYASKPIELCGVCHALKLPAMDRTGEPLGGTTVGADVVYEGHSGTVVLEGTHTSNNWAHQQVPCIRCHAHAGIQE